MITTLQQIRCMAQDIRLNPNNTKEIVEFKLRTIEDICTKAILVLNEMRNENN